MDASLTMWIASGVVDCYAKKAAGMLTIGCNQSSWDDKRLFWNKSRYGSGGCGDINGDCLVNFADVGVLEYVVAGAPNYYVTTSEWAADTNCDGLVNFADVGVLEYVVAGAPGCTLRCCSGC